MTISEVRRRRRWLWLAFPEDAEQSVSLAQLLHQTEHRQAICLDYLLSCLRHECWDRVPTRRPAKPKQLRPSRDRVATGYRKSNQAHAKAWAKRETP